MLFIGLAIIAAGLVLLWRIKGQSHASRDVLPAQGNADEPTVRDLDTTPSHTPIPIDTRSAATPHRATKVDLPSVFDEDVPLDIMTAAHLREVLEQKDQNPIPGRVVAEDK